jgi:hydrogenase expression/formation protein HypC
MCLAIPGEVERIEGGDDAALRRGLVRFGTALREVCLAFVPEAAVGDFVLVHVGVAIARIDEEAAHRCLALLAVPAERPRGEEAGTAVGGESPAEGAK